MPDVEVTRGDRVFVREGKNGHVRVLPGKVKDIAGQGLIIVVGGKNQRFVRFKDLSKNESGPWGRDSFMPVPPEPPPLPSPRPRPVESAPKPKPDMRSDKSRIKDILGKYIELDEHNCCYVDVTPEMARRWLEEAEEKPGKPRSNVRTLTNNRVALYARKILNGEVNPAIGEPIAFNGVWRMINGQHRCWAIDETGKTVRLRILFYATEEQERNFDTGMVRPLHVLIKQPLSEVKIVNSIFFYGSEKDPRVSLTADEGIELHSAYQKSISWVLNVESTSDGRKMMRAADVLAVIARAHHSGEDSEMLAAFLQRIRSETNLKVPSKVKLTDDQKTLCTRLGQFLSTTPSHGDTSRTERTGKAEWALHAFLRGEPAKHRLLIAKSPIWPCTVKAR